MFRPSDQDFKIPSMYRIPTLWPIGPKPCKQDGLWAVWSPRERQLLYLPRGSTYPIFKDSGPKSHQGYGFWNQGPKYVLGTRTLWVLLLSGSRYVVRTIHRAALCKLPVSNARIRATRIPPGKRNHAGLINSPYIIGTPPMGPHYLLPGILADPFIRSISKTGEGYQAVGSHGEVYNSFGSKHGVTRSNGPS